MDAFETSLRGAFAELPEPADEGFTAHVTQRVARRERFGVVGVLTQRVGMAAAAAATLYGAVQMLSAFAPQLMATLGLELARAHGALSSGTLDPAFGAAATQMLLITAAVIAGGTVAYRTANNA